MLGDNETSLILIKDPESQNRTKHIDVMHYHMKGLMEEGVLEIKLIFSSLILTNSLTKALPAELFKRHQEE